MIMLSKTEKKIWYGHAVAFGVLNK